MTINYVDPTTEFETMGLFPCPVYRAKMNSGLNSVEEKEIEDIIKTGTHQTDSLDQYSENTHIFDTKLKYLKEFIEKHINIYVKEIINPKEELDFYITQSWVNVIAPGGWLITHEHSNSIISGVFYVSTVEDDKINFTDPKPDKYRISIESKDTSTPWSADNCYSPVENNVLLLFPSWLKHGVPMNKKQTKNRISISFNTFARGIFGNKHGINTLILK